jgi:hypothetical protein
MNRLGKAFPTSYINVRDALASFSGLLQLIETMKARENRPFGFDHESEHGEPGDTATAKQEDEEEPPTPAGLTKPISPTPPGQTPSTSLRTAGLRIDIGSTSDEAVGDEQVNQWKTCAQILLLRWNHLHAFKMSDLFQLRVFFDAYKYFTGWIVLDFFLLDLRRSR